MKNKKRENIDIYTTCICGDEVLKLEHREEDDKVFNYLHAFFSYNFTPTVRDNQCYFYFSEKCLKQFVNILLMNKNMDYLAVSNTPDKGKLFTFLETGIDDSNRRINTLSILFTTSNQVEIKKYLGLIEPDSEESWEIVLSKEEAAKFAKAILKEVIK